MLKIFFSLTFYEKTTIKYHKLNLNSGCRTGLSGCWHTRGDSDHSWKAMVGVTVEVACHATMVRGGL